MHVAQNILSFYHSQVLDLAKQLQRTSDQVATANAAAAAAGSNNGPKVVRAQPAWKQQLQDQDSMLQVGVSMN